MTLDQALVHLPSATLLLGPGGWEAGLELYEQHRSAFSGRVTQLDAANARYVADQAYIRPVGKAFRVYLINLDGASDAAQNILLKVIEEPPPTVRFILTASFPPLPTIVGRCQVLVAGPPEVMPQAARTPEQVLVSAAVRAARDGQQQVLETALHRWDPAHTVVLRAWAAERAADRWHEFDPEFVPGVTVRQAMVILAVLRAYEGAKTAPAVALQRAFASS
jgi:DNA polymerase III, delta subunit